MKHKKAVSRKLQVPGSKFKKLIFCLQPATCNVQLLFVEL